MPFYSHEKDTVPALTGFVFQYKLNTIKLRMVLEIVTKRFKFMSHSRANLQMSKQLQGSS